MSAERPGHLTNMLSNAVRRAASAVIAAHPSEHFAGFALCTDDDLRTVFHVAVTEEFLELCDNPETRYVPVDWPYDEGAAFLDDANKLLRRRAEAETGDRVPIAESFTELVDALAKLRSDGLFADGVLLIVTSTDPGPKLEELADTGVRLLNNPRTHAAWKAAMGLA